MNKQPQQQQQQQQQHINKQPQQQQQQQQQHIKQQNDAAVTGLPFRTCPCSATANDRAITGLLSVPCRRLLGLRVGNKATKTKTKRRSGHALNIQDVQTIGWGMKLPHVISGGHLSRGWPTQLLYRAVPHGTVPYIQCNTVQYQSVQCTSV